LSGMDDALIARRFESAAVARLATVTAAGWPHVVPCCFVLAGNRIFSAVDDVKAKSTRDLRRLDHIRAHPEVSVLVDHYEEDWSQLWWIRADGRARVADRDAEALRLLAAKYAQYEERPPPGPIVIIDVERWRAWP
jgi:PPOX class probable F420-dependent enzyme